MWWDLSEDQRKTKHLPSIYNAALHGKTGWATAANAIIKYRMPQLPMLRAEDGVTEHINIVGTFCRDLADWMKKIAATTVAYWKTNEYKEARRLSMLPY